MMYFKVSPEHVCMKVGVDFNQEMIFKKRKFIPRSLSSGKSPTFESFSKLSCHGICLCQSVLVREQVTGMALMSSKMICF